MLSLPLRSHEQDVPLDLQALLDLSYQKGRYDTLDYARDPDPPLPAEDAAWAHELLVAAGRR